MKYSLTDKTKTLAHSWASEWKAEQMEDNFVLLPITGGDRLIGYHTFKGGPSTTKNITLGSLRELERYGFIGLREDSKGKIEITLYQNLRSAVETDFEIPEAPPHTIAGTLIQGDAHVTAGGFIANSIYGNVNVTSSTDIASKIEELMGDSVDEIPGLKDAIDEVRITIDPQARWRKLSKVSTLISGSLSNLTNLGGASATLILIAEAIARHLS